MPVDPTKEEVTLDLPDTDHFDEGMKNLLRMMQKEFEKRKGAGKEEEIKAKYKIEIMFSKHRSPNPDVPNPGAVSIWESGKRLHGGGDEKMYWCGYEDCRKPVSTDNFGMVHLVCPHCNREQFMSELEKGAHIRKAHNMGKDTKGIMGMPILCGEYFFNATNNKLCDFVVKTWYELQGDCDIYLKFSPRQIRYDPKDHDHRVVDATNRARMARQPVIYPLKNILKDTGAGADLRTRILAFLSA